MNSKIKSILYDMRHQPVVTWITLTGTALTMFLIIIVVAIQSIYVMPFAPESCRDRLLLGKFIHTEGQGRVGSSNLTYETAKFLYEGLDGIEEISYFTPWIFTQSVKGPTDKMFDADNRRVDANFFRIFDHELVEGRYFTQDEVKSDLKLAVITESVARDLFGKEPVIGNTFVMGADRYKAVGIVRDNSTLAQTAHGEIFTPVSFTNPVPISEDVFGDLNIAMLRADGVDRESVAKQVQARYAALDTELASKNQHTVYHGAPFDQEAIAAGINGSNTTPNVEEDRIKYAMLYAVLILVPAINLGAMLQSRLRRRVSELGVRRAFGCTRIRIISDIISENFIVSLIGALVGFVLAVIVLTSVGGIAGAIAELSDVTIPLHIILNWRILTGAFLGCFILNIISASIPAWQASRLNPVTAINMERQ